MATNADSNLFERGTTEADSGPSIHRSAFAAREFKTVEEAIFGCLTSEEIRQFGRTLDVVLPTKKQEMVAAVLERLHGTHLDALWTRMTDIEKAAVAEAVHSNPPCHDKERFRAKYGEYAPWSSGRGGAASRLELFFYGPDRRMPDDLRARMRAFAAPPRPVAVKVLDAVPATTPRKHVRRVGADHRREESVVEEPVVVRAMEEAAQHNLVAVLRLLDGGKLNVSDRTRLPGAATSRRVADVLEGGDFYEPDAGTRAGGDEESAGPIQSFAWPVLLQAAGLAVAQGTRLVLTRKGSAALKSPTPNVLRDVWDRWLKTKILDEYARVDVVRGQERAMSAVPPRRDAVADGLAECPVGSWVAVDDFWRFLRAADLDFSVARHPWRLYIAERRYGSLGDQGHRNWSILQGRYVLALLFEYVATLGMVDVAYGPAEGGREDYGSLWGTDELAFFSRYDGLVAFRLTPLGEYCLGLADEFAADTPAPSEWVGEFRMPVRSSGRVSPEGSSP